MRVIIFPRWVELSKRKKLVIGIIGLLGALFLSTAIWFALTPDAPSSFSGNNSMPVNAQMGDSGIQFATERVMPPLKGEDYFVNYRIQREQSRQEAKTMLSSLLNSSVTKTKEEAQQKWLELSNKIEKEGQVENLLKIKGFQDAVVNVTKNGVNVMIYASSLTPDEVRLIQDIVIRVTHVRVDEIQISFKK